MNKVLHLTLFLISTLLFCACKKGIKSINESNFPVTIINQTILETKEAISDSFDLTPYMEVFVKRNEAPSFTDTSEQQNKLWRQYNDSAYQILLNHDRICWFRLTVVNNRSGSFKRLLWFSSLDRVTVYDSFGEIGKAGELVPLNEWSDSTDNHCITITINNHQTKTYYIQCYRQRSAIKHPVKFILRSEQDERSFQLFEIKSRMVDTVFLFFYLGFLFFAFIYFLAQYLFNLNEKILLVYCLYILFTFLYSFRDVDKHYFLQTAFPVFNGINIWGEGVFSYLSYIFYILFLIYLLELQRKPKTEDREIPDKEKEITHKKNAYRLLMSGVSIITLLLIIDIILRLTGNDTTALQIFTVTRMALFPLIIVFFLLIRSLNKSYYAYFLTGTIFLVLGTGINLSIFLIRDSADFIFHEAISSRYGFWGNTVNYTRLGIILEVLFFSLGLAKKMRMAFAEAVRREASDIEIRFHTHEVASGLKTLEIRLNKGQETMAYLGLFNKYLRTVLKLMKEKDGIELKTEVEMADAYFKLRQEHNRHYKFTFEDNKINTDNIFIPAGLLIPFIQNFFDHAVTCGKKDFKFEVELYKKGEKINLEITDNGPGIDTNHIYNKTGSSGLDIARRKINLFNSLRGTKLNFKIGNNPKAEGTLITISNLPKKM